MQPQHSNTATSQSQSQSQSRTQTQTTEFHDTDREMMEAKIREALETLSQIQVTVMNHESADEQVLQQRVDRLVRGFAEMHTAKDRLNVSVPEEVLAYIRDGRNPDEFTSQFMERVASENQFTNGKIAALTNFKHEFQEKLKEFFPEESSEKLDSQKPANKDDEAQ
ncbi:RNA polymerase II mediator complex subunit [Coemansia sp. RSA 1933]|nr:RNA polymerase II mediator complex subunit [Coemansia sp. RSA 1933]